MRKIEKIIVHCTATREGWDVTADQVRAWHRARGWQDIGYHYLIRLDGRIEKGREDGIVGAHCKNHNARSLGVCYVGGLDLSGKPKDTRTDAQKDAMSRLIRHLVKTYPGALVFAHRDFDPWKACPCFDATKEYNA